MFSQSRYGYSFKIVRQANKKINGTFCSFGSITDVYLHTVVLNSHAAGMVSAASAVKTFLRNFEIWFCNKCQKKVDLEIFCCEKDISIRDLDGSYGGVKHQVAALEGGCTHVSICTCFFVIVFDSFSETGWAIKTIQIYSNLFARYRYVYLRWLRIVDLLVCFQTIIVRSTIVCLTLLSAHLFRVVPEPGYHAIGKSVLYQVSGHSLLNIIKK